MANTPTAGTSLYAAYRAELAHQRMEYWRDLSQRSEDHADTLRSKAARTRWLKQADKEARNANRAAQEFEKWQAEAERLIAEEEKRERRRERRRKKKGPPVPPPVKKKYEYILKVSYETGRKRSDRAHHVWWDVRFRKLDGSRATERELEYAVRRIHMGEIPRGWDVVSIAWDRGRRSSDSDVPSRTASTHSELLQAMGQLGATMDGRGGMAWNDRRDAYIGANYTVGEEEVE